MPNYLIQSFYLVVGYFIDYIFTVSVAILENAFTDLIQSWVLQIIFNILHNVIMLWDKQINAINVLKSNLIQLDRSKEN